MDHDWGLQGSITSVIFMETTFWSLLLSETIYTYLGDFQKNEDFSFSENNLNIKWYERKVNILKQAQW